MAGFFAFFVSGPCFPVCFYAWLALNLLTVTGDGFLLFGKIDKHLPIGG